MEWGTVSTESGRIVPFSGCQTCETMFGQGGSAVLMNVQLSKADIMNLPMSVRSWILLRRYLEQSWDIDVFVKVIEDYYTEIPLFEVYELFERAEQMADDQSFQWLLEHLFSLKSMNIRDRGCFPPSDVTCDPAIDRPAQFTPL